MFVSGRRSVELWLFSWSAGKPELLPNKSAYAIIEREKENETWTMIGIHKDECLTFILVLPCFIIGFVGTP